jgi:hypothetical protein
MHLALDVEWSVEWSEIHENQHNAVPLHRHQYAMYENQFDSPVGVTSSTDRRMDSAILTRSQQEPDRT